MKSFDDLFNEMFSEAVSAVVDKIKGKKIDELPFSNIFGDKLRIEIPIEEKSELVDNFTETLKKVVPNFFDIDYDKEVVKRKLTIKRPGEPESEKIQDVAIGAAIQKGIKDEVEKKKTLEFWANNKDKIKKQVKISQGGEKYSIILSRAQIDVLRMSDFSNISSCHSVRSIGHPYNYCAIDEANYGGGIAYTVLTSDLKNINLQQPEIFKDRQRKIEGIKPISRMRIRRIAIIEGGKNDLKVELAIDDGNVYGDRSVLEFESKVRKYLIDKQQKEIEEIKSIGSKNGNKLYIGYKGGEYFDAGSDPYQITKSFLKDAGYTPEGIINKGNVDDNPERGDVEDDEGYGEDSSNWMRAREVDQLIDSGHKDLKRDSFVEDNEKYLTKISDNVYDWSGKPLESDVYEEIYNYGIKLNIVNGDFVLPPFGRQKRSLTLLPRIVKGNVIMAVSEEVLNIGYENFADSSLEKVERDLMILKNSHLTNLIGFPKYIGGNLILNYSSALKSLEGIGEVKGIIKIKNTELAKQLGVDWIPGNNIPQEALSPKYIINKEMDSNLTLLNNNKEGEEYHFNGNLNYDNWKIYKDHNKNITNMSGDFDANERNLTTFRDNCPKKISKILFFNKNPIIDFDGCPEVGMRIEVMDCPKLKSLKGLNIIKSQTPRIRITNTPIFEKIKDSFKEFPFDPKNPRWQTDIQPKTISHKTLIKNYNLLYENENMKELIELICEGKMSEKELKIKINDLLDTVTINELEEIFRLINYNKVKEEKIFNEHIVEQLGTSGKSVIPLNKLIIKSLVMNCGITEEKTFNKIIKRSQSISLIDILKSHPTSGKLADILSNSYKDLIPENFSTFFDEMIEIKLNGFATGKAELALSLLTDAKKTSNSNKEFGGDVVSNNVSIEIKVGSTAVFYIKRDIIEIYNKIVDSYFDSENKEKIFSYYNDAFLKEIFEEFFDLLSFNEFKNTLKSYFQKVKSLDDLTLNVGTKSHIRPLFFALGMTQSFKFYKYDYIMFFKNQAPPYNDFISLAKVSDNDLEQFKYNLDFIMSNANFLKIDTTSGKSSGGNRQGLSITWRF